MTERLRILHLEDNPADQELISEILRRELECTIEDVSTRAAFTAALKTSDPDVIILDYNVPGFDGLEALDSAKERFPDVPVIFVSGTIGDERAVQIIKHGANDYVLKDRMTGLPSVIRRALEERQLQKAYQDAREQLQASETRFRNLVEHLPIVTYLAPLTPPSEPGAKPPSFATYISPQVTELLGIPLEEFLAEPEPLVAFVHPADRDRVAHEVTCAWERRQRSVALEYRTLAASGDARWVRNTARVFSDPVDGSLWVQGFIVDVTEAVESQAALHASEEAYRTLVNEMPAAAFTATASTNVFSGSAFRPTVTFVSPQVMDLIGRSPDEITAHPAATLKLVHRDDLKPVLIASAKAVLAGRPISFEVRVRHASGEFIWARVDATFTRDDESGLVILHGFATDITGRKAAQAQLLEANRSLEARVTERTAELSRTASGLQAEVLQRRNAEDRLSRTLRFAPLPIMLHAEDGQILLVNDCWQQITGYSEAEITTIEAWAGRAYGPRADLVLADIRRLFAADGPIDEGEDTITMHDGTTRMWEFHSAPLGTDSSGRKLVVTMARDVTERKRDEQELRHAREAADSANVAKTRFLANMSHELRTPLGTIIGFAQILQERLFGDLNEKQEEQIGFVLQSAQHLLSLINDILDLSKIEAGKMELQPSPLHIASLLEGSLNMVREQCLRKGVSLTLDLAPDTATILIPADERALKQVMYNLLSNAMKFTPRDGSIVVGSRLQSDSIVVSVTDTGIGIAPELHQTVFGEFYQVQNNESGKTAGTGLGLSLVKQLVEMHGGSVCLESDGIGTGSTFSFSLPLKGRDTSAGDASAEQVPRDGFSAALETFLSHHDQLCLCRFQPTDASATTDPTAVMHVLASGKRADDVVLEIENGRCALLLTGADRQGAETACRRIVTSLESTFVTPWRWAIAASAEDGRDPERLIEILGARIGGMS